MKLFHGWLEQFGYHLPGAIWLPSESDGPLSVSTSRFPLSWVTICCHEAVGFHLLRTRAKRGFAELDGGGKNRKQFPATLALSFSVWTLEPGSSFHTFLGTLKPINGKFGIIISCFHIKTEKKKWKNFTHEPLSHNYNRESIIILRKRRRNLERLACSFCVVCFPAAARTMQASWCWRSSLLFVDDPILMKFLISFVSGARKTFHFSIFVFTALRRCLTEVNH